jgi:hypothetical protein
MRASRLCLLLGVCSSTIFAVRAQEVVHALSGTVSAIDSKDKTIDIKTADGSEGMFKDLTKADTSLDFDKAIRSNSVPAESFSKQGVNVIVFYYGDSDVRTVVALRDLGPGPFTRSNGTVDKYNRHEHLLVLKDSTGASQSFHIDPKTVVEGAVGAIEGDRYDPQKGDRLYVLSAAGNGNPEALFIRLQ